MSSDSLRRDERKKLRDVGVIFLVVVALLIFAGWQISTRTEGWVIPASIARAEQNANIQRRFSEATKACADVPGADYLGCKQRVYDQLRDDELRAASPTVTVERN